MAPNDVMTSDKTCQVGRVAVVVALAMLGVQNGGTDGVNHQSYAGHHHGFFVFYLYLCLKKALYGVHGYHHREHQEQYAAGKG